MREAADLKSRFLTDTLAADPAMLNVLPPRTLIAPDVPSTLIGTSRIVYRRNLGDSTSPTHAASCKRTGRSYSARPVPALRLSPGSFYQLRAHSTYTWSDVQALCQHTHMQNRAAADPRPSWMAPTQQPV